MQYWQSGLTYRRHTILFQLDMIDHISCISCLCMYSLTLGQVTWLKLSSHDLTPVALLFLELERWVLIWSYSVLMRWAGTNLFWSMDFVVRVAGVSGICRYRRLDQGEGRDAWQEIWREPGGGRVLPWKQVCWWRLWWLDEVLCSVDTRITAFA